MVKPAAALATENGRKRRNVRSAHIIAAPCDPPRARETGQQQQECAEGGQRKAELLARIGTKTAVTVAFMLPLGASHASVSAGMDLRVNVQYRHAF